MLFDLKGIKTVTKAQAEFVIFQPTFSFMFHTGKCPETESVPNILMSVIIFYFHPSSFTKDILQWLFLGDLQLLLLFLSTLVLFFQIGSNLFP